MNTTSQKTERTPQEFATNYPVIKTDGFFGPISVGNIVEYNSRIMMNLCIKTNKTGDRNAVSSYPSEWYQFKPFPFRCGDQVNVLIQDGYVKKVFKAKPTAVSTISAAVINQEVAEARNKIAADAEKEGTTIGDSDSVSNDGVAIQQPF